MFTSRVIMDIKPGSAAEVGRIFEGEVVPLLREHEGMCHEDTFISPQLSEAVLNSYWVTQEYAEAYGRAAYPAALKALSKVLVGRPRVETFGISSSTFHRITGRRREAQRASQLGRGVGPHAPLAHQPKLREESSATLNCKINERRVGAVTILDLDGELRSGASRDALHDAIERLSEEGRNQILLNLSGLYAIDAGGLGNLLKSNIGLNKGGGQLKLLRPARALRDMLLITKLLNVFDIYENESEAVEGFARPILDPEGQLLSYEHARYETHP